MFHISDFLSAFDNTDGRGNCNACQMKVQWNKASVTAHVQDTCPMTTEADRTSLAKIVKTEPEEAASFEMETPSILSEAIRSSSTEFDVSDFLSHSQTFRGKGECKACGTPVQWSRQKLAQHKRSTCTQATDHEKELFALKPVESRRETRTRGTCNPVTQETFAIHDFLERNDDYALKGKCRACGIYVQWSRKKIAQHVRSSCSLASQEDKFLFSKKVSGTTPHGDYSTVGTKKKVKRPARHEAFDIAEYLENFDATTNLGTCQLCGITVQWSRSRLAAHKRASCRQATAKEKDLFAMKKEDRSVPKSSRQKSSPATLPQKFAVSDFLSDFDSQNKGRCRACGTSVQWSRQKLAQHMRSTCPSATVRQKLFFKQHDNRKVGTTDGEASSDGGGHENFVAVDIKQQEDSSDDFNFKTPVGCFICSEAFGHPGPIELTNILSSTRTPLFRVLESFTDIELSVQATKESGVCQECFMNLEKYDSFQKKSQEIQEKVTATYFRTHKESVFIKQEPELDVSETVFLPSFEDTEQVESASKQKRLHTDDERPLSSNATQPSSDCKFFQCYKCGRPCKTQHGTRIHLITEHSHSNDSFECPDCLKVFPDKDRIRSHFNRHKKTEFLCMRCGKIFANKKYYKRHSMIHDDVRPFKCLFEGCGKSFRTSVNLNTHKRVHSGEKIFECPFCPGKRFAQSWGRLLHTRKHHKRKESEAMENCRICGTVLENKSKMRAHLAKVHQVV